MEVRITVTETEEVEDETGADRLWDLAARIAIAVGFARGEESPVYASEWGQEEIYNILQELK